MSRAAGPIAGAVVAGALAFGYRLTRLPAPAPTTAGTPPVPVSVPSVASSAARSAEGDALWRQSIQASGPKGTPIKAHVTITRGAGNSPETTEFDLSDGGGRYRLSYTAPQSARGRVVVCDGKTLWQYEPTRKTVLRRPLSVAAGSPLEETALPSGVIAEVEGDAVSLDGRPTRVLTFRDARGALLSRRWLDTTNRRSLKSETYDPQTGKRLVQVTLTKVEPLPDPDPALFRPDFPDSARVLKGGAARPPDLTKAANRAGLPLAAGVYRLRSVLRSRSPLAALPSSEIADHLIYSNGINTVSVFAPVKTSDTGTLRPGSSWQQVTLPPDTPAFLHTDRQGRTALVWLRNGKRLIAVSRLPASELLMMARSLSAGK